MTEFMKENDNRENENKRGAVRPDQIKNIHYIPAVRS
jgi:hypothetical protein